MATAEQPPSSPTPGGEAETGAVTLARLQVINEVSAAALRQPSVPEIYRVAAEAIVRHFAFFEAAVFAVRGAEGRAVLVAQSPPRELDRDPPYSQPLEAGLVGVAAREQRSVMANDVGSEPCYVRPPRDGPCCASELCAPVVRDGEVVAVVDVACQEPGAFGEGDRVALEAIANVVGLAVQAAETHQALQQQVERLRAMQCQLVNTERLADVGRLTSRVAHEIRNPLSTMGGFARRIARNPQCDEKAVRDARIIVDEVQRLERLLGGVMGFVRPGPPKKAPTDINAILLRSIHLCRGDAKGKHITCHKHLGPDLPLVHVDPGQIEQVLVNVLKNAADSIEDRGTVTVATAREGDHVVIRVSDTGHGIPPDQLANVFDPFFTTKPGGTGLGLAVAAKIIDDHGGHIVIGSEPGKGTHVNIRLPIGPGESRP
ncbi:MAG: ATP-binding protein [Candidatus Brocadiia bacterium]